MTLVVPRHGIISAIRKLGLTPGLQIVWDAGDEASFPGSGQNWANLGPTANCDLWLGNSAAVAANDPTFTGVAGRRSDGEYFAMDGGDFFYAQGAMPANIYSTHKDNALFTLAGWFFRTVSTGRAVATAAGNNTDVGIQWGVNSTPSLFFTVYRGNAAGPSFSYTSAALTSWPVNTWAFVATSIDEANNSGIGKVNGQTMPFACTYVSPTAVGPSSGTIVGSDYNNSFPAPAGSRYASLCMWEGRALTAEELEALYQATRGKYGV